MVFSLFQIRKKKILLPGLAVLRVSAKNKSTSLLVFLRGSEVRANNTYLDTRRLLYCAVESKFGLIWWIYFLPTPKKQKRIT
ncbi:MAG: hypothetical protein PVI90_14975, partial [Desulfobacteraceae bacterium]